MSMSVSTKVYVRNLMTFFKQGPSKTVNYVYVVCQSSNLPRDTDWPKKSALFCFSSQSCVLHYFFIFFRWCRYQAWTVSQDKSHPDVLYRKISSSDTTEYRKDFGRNNVPDGRTIQCLVAKFTKIGSVADCQKGWHRSSFGIILENIQNYRKAMRNLPEKQQPLSHKKLAFPEHQYWGSSMMTLSSFVTKFRSCRGKLI